MDRANYQAYAAAAAAAYATSGPAYDQYQAAYNAAATYRAIQQPQQQPRPQGNNFAAPSMMAAGGISISQPAQRYDFASSKFFFTRSRSEGFEKQKSLLIRFRWELLL